MIDFSHYAPQRMFLVQGGEETFDALLASRSVSEPMTQALSVPRFTIDHARSVAAFALEGTGQSRTYIIYFSVFSPEAAQVLLKSLEEPAPDTTVIFVTRHPYLVPQTVRSRLMIIDSGVWKGGKSEKTKDIIEQIQKEAQEKDDDAALRRSRATILLDALEMSVREERARAGLVYEAKKMLMKENIPTKFVLDYIATVIR